jgi:hypothetical protein
MDPRANSFRQAYFTLLEYEASGPCQKTKTQPTILAPGHRWITHVPQGANRPLPVNRGMNLNGFFSGND